jgi:exportin-1
MDNASFLRDHVVSLLVAAFPNLSKAQVLTFVNGCFDVSKDLTAFKQHLRDFLITIKEFSDEDNSELYREEYDAKLEEEKQAQYSYMASVPGLIKPVDLPLEDDPDL